VVELVLSLTPPSPPPSSPPLRTNRWTRQAVRSRARSASRQRCASTRSSSSTTTKRRCSKHIANDEWLAVFSDDALFHADPSHADAARARQGIHATGRDGVLRRRQEAAGGSHRQAPDRAVVGRISALTHTTLDHERPRRRRRRPRAARRIELPRLPDEVALRGGFVDRLAAGRPATRGLGGSPPRPGDNPPADRSCVPPPPPIPSA